VAWEYDASASAAPPRGTLYDNTKRGPLPGLAPPAPTAATAAAAAPPRQPEQQQQQQQPPAQPPPLPQLPQQQWQAPNPANPAYAATAQHVQWQAVPRDPSVVPSVRGVGHDDDLNPGVGAFGRVSPAAAHELMSSLEHELRLERIESTLGIHALTSATIAALLRARSSVNGECERAGTRLTRQRTEQARAKAMADWNRRCR
jgi:hypothetical protein